LMTLYTLPGVLPVVAETPLLARRKSASSRALVGQACGDARPELVLYEFDASGRAVSVAAYQTDPAIAQKRCNQSFSVGANHEYLLDVFAVNGGFAAIHSGGFLVTLDLQDGLLGSNIGSGELTLPGVRVGGYYNDVFYLPRFPIAPTVGATTP